MKRLVNLKYCSHWVYTFKSKSGLFMIQWCLIASLAYRKHLRRSYIISNIDREITYCIWLCSIWLIQMCVCSWKWSRVFFGQWMTKANYLALESVRTVNLLIALFINGYTLNRLIRFHLNCVHKRNCFRSFQCVYFE